MTIEATIRQILREELTALREELRSLRHPAPSAWMTIEEAAQHAGYSTATIRAWCGSGSLQASKIGRRWRIRREDLTGFLFQRRGSAAAEVDIERQAAAIIAMDRDRGGSNG